MKVHIIVCLILIAFLNIPSIIFSQTGNSNHLLERVDSLEAGNKYTLTLFNEKQITGTFVTQDSKSITIKSDDIQMTIQRKNILRVSKYVPSGKLNFLATLNGGWIPNSYHHNFYSTGPNWILDGRFSYFFSEKKNIGVEFAFTSFDEPNRNISFNAPPPVEGQHGKGPHGDGYNFDIMANGQIGTFDKNKTVDLYLNLGAGMHIQYRNSFPGNFYQFNDTNFFFNPHLRSSYTDFYPMIQIGGGIIIKPEQNFGINLECDLNAFGSGDFIFPSQTYIPIKAGISYYFIK
jgi:hypothetical protein